MDFFSEIDSLFQNFASHDRYIIREKLYNGKGIEIGLAPLHNKFIELQQKILATPVESLEYYAPSLKKSTEKLYETLKLLYNFENISSDMNTVLKFIHVAQIEIGELAEIIAGIQFFDPSSIKSNEEIQKEKIHELQLKIQDNLMQLTKSFEWKIQEAELKRTIQGREIIDQLTNIINTITKQIESIQNFDYLSMLSLLAIRIREEAATLFDSINMNLPLYATFVRIYFLISEHEDTHISCEQLKNDVEHFLTIGGLAWLTSIHAFIVGTDTRDKTRWKFAEQLYRMSRDPKEAFQVTMSLIGNASANTTLINLTNDFATLLSCLLGISSKLEERNQLSVVAQIEKVSQLNPLDAVADLSELYHPAKIKPEHFINALKKKIMELQQIALDIILDPEVAETFLIMVQFTDFDAHISTTADLTDYILQKGVV